MVAFSTEEEAGVSTWHFVGFLSCDGELDTSDQNHVQRVNEGNGRAWSVGLGGRNKESRDQQQGITSVGSPPCGAPAPEPASQLNPSTSWVGRKDLAISKRFEKCSRICADWEIVQPPVP